VTLLEGLLIGAAIVTALIAVGALGCDLVVDWWRGGEHDQAVPPLP
jgi:hypothetical protein